MKPKSNNQDLFAFLHLGWMIALILTLFTLSGIHLDKRYDTSPLLLLIAVFLAFLTAGYLVYREIKRLTDFKPPDTD